MRDREIAACFNVCFAQEQHTQMFGGADEPLYLPILSGHSATLFYRQDFAASALHEAAHWCIAGPERRRQIDFGYRYEPPPRSVSAQMRFFACEVKAQTLESIFAQAAGNLFNPSADNLSADVVEFTAALYAAKPAMLNWLNGTTGARARRFRNALAVQSSGAHVSKRSHGAN